MCVTKAQLTTQSDKLCPIVMIGKLVNSFGGYILNEVMCFKILNCSSR